MWAGMNYTAPFLPYNLHLLRFSSIPGIRIKVTKCTWDNYVYQGTLTTVQSWGERHYLF
jgi:hypothetical protein